MILGEAKSMISQVLNKSPKSLPEFRAIGLDTGLLFLDI